jgi:ABC-type nickel/cobalt efflux system permease component RcnA
MRELTSDLNLRKLMIFLGISFLYGIIHSAGPGHGKAIIFTFFLKERHYKAKAVLMAGLTAFTHTLSAIILALLMNTLLVGIKGFLRIKMQGYFIFANGILIMIIGILFLIKEVLAKNKEVEEELATNNNIYLIGITAGLIPCPASLMIMLFSISNRIIPLGLLSVLGISVGMFVLLIAVGILSIKCKENLSNVKENKTAAITRGVEFLSIILIICIGLLMSLTVIF